MKKIKPLKIGRNEQCWCGSGDKYKKCHLNRSEQEPVRKEEILKNSNNFNSIKRCSVPLEFKSKCSKKIIKAHSVSKSSSLKPISENGHILTMFQSNHDFNLSQYITPKRIGINQASIFTGFCEVHDKQLFSPIEDKPFDSSSYHCFLIAYRSLCRELFVKDSASKVFNFVRELDRGKCLTDQISIQKMQKHFTGQNNLTIHDLKYLKNKLDRILIEKNYDEIHHIVFELESAPNVMASAVVGHMFGFDGGLLQITSDDPSKIPDYVFLNSFSSDNLGYIILSWVPEHKKCNLEFIRQLSQTKCLSSSLAIFTFAMVENTYMSPSWWQNLGKKIQNEVCAIFCQGVSRHTDNNVLVNKPMIDPIKVIKTTCVGY